MGIVTSNPDVRVLPATRYPYRIYYSIQNNEIFILHIRHTARRAPDDLRTLNCAERTYRICGRACQAAFSSCSVHLPSVAAPFMRARCEKARWPAATFSGLPPQALRHAACSARP